MLSDQILCRRCWWFAAVMFCETDIRLQIDIKICCNEDESAPQDFGNYTRDFGHTVQILHADGSVALEKVGGNVRSKRWAQQKIALDFDLRTKYINDAALISFCCTPSGIFCTCKKLLKRVSRYRGVYFL